MPPLRNFCRTLLISHQIVDEKTGAGDHYEILRVFLFTAVPYVVQQFLTLDAHQFDGHAASVGKSRILLLGVAVGEPYPGLVLLAGILTAPFVY